MMDDESRQNVKPNLSNHFFPLKIVSTSEASLNATDISEISSMARGGKLKNQHFQFQFWLLCEIS